MDLSVLPTLCSLVVFVCCFRPLVRRAGPHTNVWFAGWTFLLLHYCLMLPPALGGPRGQALELLCTWTSELCGLCFIWAATCLHAGKVSQAFAFWVGMPVLLQSFLYAYGMDSLTLRLVASLLMLAPAVHLWVVPEDRAGSFQILSAAFAFVAVMSATVPPLWAVHGTLCVIFLIAAYETFSGHSRHLTLGVWLMSGGLVAWAFCYPLQLTGWLPVQAHLAHTIYDIPRYAVAAGTILTLLNEYLHRAESLALHDPLTGLPNRRLFDIRLEQAIHESQITQTPIACLVIDVDKFKYINDTFGHPVGDGLLQALTKRLSWNLGPRDMLARTGGDEFTAILVEAADEHHVRFIAGAMMAAGCVPVSIGRHLIDVRISIGIAVAPQDATEPLELHRLADEAMYRAKRRGGAGVAFSYEELGQIHAV